MFLAKILDGLVAALSHFGTLVALVWSDGLPGWPFWLFILLFWFFWLGSGFFAATVAELFRQPVGRHFFLGLLIPYFYPLWLARHIEQGAEAAAIRAESEADAAEKQRAAEISGRFAKMQAERAAKRRERIADQAGISVAELDEEMAVREEAAASRTPSEPVAAEPEPAAPAAGNEIRQILYEQPVADDGSRPGPFELLLRDGSTVAIDAVRSLQDDFMMCVVSATGKTVRVKYQNVESVSRLG